jgi:opacity protein-like surface antigen
MRRALLAAVLALVVFPAAAAAKDTPLWATVNVCDTAKQPNRLGIRAAMAGTPKGARLYMRFRAQYRSGDDWVDVDDADSGWVSVGTARGTQVQYGWSFTFARNTRSTVLRGVVRFRWRRGDSLPKHAEEATEGGHRSSAGADPPGYSAATCALGS